MTRSRPPQVAFNSGEISPRLAQRYDYQRYKTGLARCRGFMPMREGPVTRAPGTWFRGYTRDDAPGRRIAFEFSEVDALELEFTAGVMRVRRYGDLVMDGASPYELATPYDADAIARLSWVQSADVIYLADGQLPIHKLSRFALDNWTIEPFQPEDGPFRNFNLDEDVKIQASAGSGTGIILTATGGNVFEASHVGSLMMLEPEDFSQVPGWTGNTNFSTGDRVRYDGNTYELVSGSGDVGPTPPQHLEGTRQVSKGVSWKFIAGSFGIVRITAVNSATEAVADVIRGLPAGCVDDPTYIWSEAAWSDRHGYPSVLELYQQRLVAAATPKDPRTLWFSAAGTTEVFEPGEDADDAFAYAIGGDSSINRIIWLREGSRGLYIGALGEERSTASTDGSIAIGPTTVEFRRGSRIGSRPARPAVPHGNPVFLSKDGRRVVEIVYTFEQDRNIPREISLPASHLGGPGFAQIEMQSAPDPYLWIRRDDGLIAICLHDPGEEVLGWCLLPVAGGFVEDLTVTPAPDGRPDVVTAIVRRTLGGVERRCIEEFGVCYGLEAAPPPLDQAHFFFCASRFEVDPAQSSFSVPHLAGEEVHVWTDRGAFGPITVAGDGTVTIDEAVNKATIGLFDDTHEGETLPVVPASPEGHAMGRARQLTSDLGLAVQNTADGWIETYTEELGQPRRVSGRQDILVRQVASDLTAVFSGTTRVPAVSGKGGQVGIRFGPRGGAPMTVSGFAPSIEEAGP